MEPRVCPSTLQEGYDTYSPPAIKQLFNGKKVSHNLDFDFEKELDSEIIASNIDRISVSGVQEKLSAIVDNGRIRLTESGECSTHILKPAPLDYDLKSRKQIPANEHLTMQIAGQVYGIKTAANGLCFDKKGRPVYITRRFDITAGGEKTHMEDFASLLGRDENSGGKYYKYEGFYEDIADCIRHYVAAWPIHLECFFRIVVFNYIYGNGDAHLKNFSLQLVGDEFVLAPAYDLMNTCLHVNGDDFGLSNGLLRSGRQSDTYVRTGHPCRADFAEFGIKTGINPARVNHILDAFSSIPAEVNTLIGNSFLDNKNKRDYLRIIAERTARFNRKDD